MINKKFYLVIQHDDKTFVTSYDDECLARVYMLHDISNSLINDNITIVTPLSDGVTEVESVDKRIKWKIVEGSHIDGIYEPFEPSNKFYCCKCGKENTYFKSRINAISHIYNCFIKHFGYEDLNENLKKKILERIVKIIDDKMNVTICNVEQYGKIMNLPNLIQCDENVVWKLIEYDFTTMKG